jgi:hypothetical protein
MRIFAIILVALVFITDLAPGRAADIPRFRPALPGSGPDALINKILVQDLVGEGQKSGTVMFCSRISKTGDILWFRTYKAMPGSERLKTEVEKALRKVKFFPAIYEHQPVDVIYYGTVTFTVVDKIPRLRIFANQDPKELKEEKDFISPQPIVGGVSPFTGMHYPERITVVLNGMGYLALKVDATGNLQDLQVVGEEPPLSGFGDVAAADFNKAKFIPAFRNGDPEESETTLPVYYVPEREFEEPKLFGP